MRTCCRQCTTAAPLAPTVGRSCDVVRDRVAQEWAALPLTADNYSGSLKAKVERLKQDMHGLKGARAGAAAARAAVGAAAGPAAVAKA